MYTEADARTHTEAGATQKPAARPSRRKIAIVSRSPSRDGDLPRTLERLGYEVDVLEHEPRVVSLVADRRLVIDAVVLDRRGAKAVDAELFKRLSSDPRLDGVPVLLVVGSQDDEQIRAALDADIHHHIRAPFRSTLLEASLRALARRRSQREDRRHGIDLKSEIPMMESCKFRLRTPAEAGQILPFLTEFFPDRRRAALGIDELLRNAIEHGNLEIGGARRNGLVKSGALQQEIYSRLLKPEYRDRAVEVVVARREDGVLLTVTDQGPGFDWKEHLDIDPSLANLDSGRGIARARHLAFDSLTFNPRGNQAIALMSHARKIDW